MVGNDVVDLRDQDAKLEFRPRFDARVFCDEELASLDASPDRARRRWQLWAAKEAAYKVVVKSDSATIFSPSRFRVRVSREGAAGEDAETGVVEFLDRVLPVRVVVRDDVVHAVVGTDRQRLVPGALDTGALDMGALVVGEKRIDTAEVGGHSPDAESRAVRRFATERLAGKLRVDGTEIEIRKQGRIPELWANGRRAAADLSLSHHGDVVGFACELGGATRVRRDALALRSAS
jgi:phosphopantetheinyl transferase